ncbi:uncharacterized protein J3R85_010415 [Psidium guajava]|nr:uncharacterized protein J3R85_010415 [Psidium guajava]
MNMIILPDQIPYHEHEPNQVFSDSARAAETRLYELAVNFERRVLKKKNFERRARRIQHRRRLHICRNGSLKEKARDEDGDEGDGDPARGADLDRDLLADGRSRVLRRGLLRRLLHRVRRTRSEARVAFNIVSEWIAISIFRVSGMAMRYSPLGEFELRPANHRAVSNHR